MEYGYFVPQRIDFHEDQESVVNLLFVRRKDSFFKILSIPIHLLVVLLVFAAGDAAHPGLVVEVPADGLLEALLELEGRLPAELPLELPAVDGIAKVVAGAVGDESDEIVILTFAAAEEPVSDAYESLYHVDVLPLVEAADVVGLAVLPFVENEVDGPRVVLHVKPVADILSLSVDRKRFAVTDIVDKQWDELLRELERAVVVRAVGNHRRQPVGVVEGADEVVAGGLRRAVGAVGLIFHILGEELLAVGKMVLSA